ncbi:protein ACCELERATED CELL DEATH 6-like [Impatiens glandulifera]|uniref:protein ACCELERATED CELL DEATH 6-like n=1 Tax=Impatiens glandulifera TaxID=253017 RepID=UPI001FB14507|nr:protein ACCELERATED CELL DEATH 6-like [Impatiens glandulifera]
MGRIDLELENRYRSRRSERNLQLLQQGQQQQQEQNGINGDSIQASDSDLEEDHNNNNNNTPEGGILNAPDPIVIMVMDLQLYRATIEGDQDKFISTLIRVSNEKGLSSSVTAILNQVTRPLGNTFLHLAAEYGHHNLAGHLACKFPHLLVTRNERGDTPFIVAARAGQKLTADIISRFAEDSPNCNSGLTEGRRKPDLMLRMTNRDGNTALHEALIAKHHDMVNCLISTDDEVPFCYPNTHGKTPLYIAIETATQITLVRRMLQLLASRNPDEIKIAGKSPINAAIKAMNTDMLVMLCEKIPSLIHTRDAEDGGTPLHCAASVGYYKGVEFFLNRCTEFILEHDNNGLLPIHIASQKGHVEIVKKLLVEYPNTREMLTMKGENILHIASKFGKIDVVKYVLENPELGILLNQKDCKGNTPLHLATRNWFPSIVSCLTWNKGVELNLVNDYGMTALDIVEEFGGISPSYRKRLTWVALKSAGGKPNKYPKALYNTSIVDSGIQNDYQVAQSKEVDYNDRVNTLLLVSTLVATVTFAAGFTMPGGYNNTLSDPFLGQATMLNKQAFQAFVICDTIAMYSAIIVAVTLIWAQLGDVHLVLSSLNLAMPLLGVSLTTMSAAFLAGVSLVVTNLGWLSHLILIMGIVFLSIILLLFIPLFLPNSSKNYVMRYISYYFFFQLLLIASGCNDRDNADEEKEEDRAA